MGTSKGDFYGASESERNTSTPYKTVYTSTLNAIEPLEFQGCAICETSSFDNSRGTGWFNGTGGWPYWRTPVFIRSSLFGWQDIFNYNTGAYHPDYGYTYIRMALAIL